MRGEVVQRLLVVAVAAGQDQGERARRQRRGQVAEGRADVADEPAARGREALGADVPVAVVEHPDVEADLGREPRHRLPDVPAADEEERDPRQRRQVRDARAASPASGASRERGEVRRDRFPRRPVGEVRRPASPVGVEQVAVADGQAERVADHHRLGAAVAAVGEVVQRAGSSGPRSREAAPSDVSGWARMVIRPPQMRPSSQP